MRRSLDFVLVVVILAAVGFGAYKLGNLVDNKSNEAASESAGTTVVTTTGGVVTTVAAHHSHKPSRRTIEITVVAIAGAAGVLLLVSLGGALFRTNRRQHWRSP